MNHSNQNDKLFIFGIICLVLALGFLFFSLYIIPYLIWEVNYDVPDFIFSMINNYQDNYNYSSVGSKVLVWSFFFIPSVIFGVLSYFISNSIDKHTPDLQPPEEQEAAPKDSDKRKESLKESASLGFKLLAIIVFIFIVFFILQQFFTATS